MTYSSKRKEMNQSLTLRTNKKFVLASFALGGNIEHKLTPLYVIELYMYYDNYSNPRGACKGGNLIISISTQFSTMIKS